MKIKTLLKGIEIEKIIGNNNLNISHLSNSTNDIKKNTLYFCLKGLQADGHDFAGAAINLGAVAIVVEKKLQIENVTQIVVKDSRLAMSLIAKNFYGNAANKIKIVTLVGTNGKTSISYIISKILDSAGIKNAIIGTTGTKVGDFELKSSLTTPDPIELHYLFKQLTNLDVKVVILEASAQAIYFKKLTGIVSDVSVFTNLSNEHLDFFGTIENYEQTKISFFNEFVKNAVLNSDSTTSLKIIKQFKSNVFTYGLYNPSDTFAIDITTSLKGSKFIVNANDQIMEIKTKLIGIYNVYNILASINTCLLLGCTTDNIISGLQKLNNIPGRMNVYHLDCNNKVIIDYAHTPDGFYQVLSLIRKLRQENIICVFGCVGYSDSEKRKEMGKIASNYCDEIIITTDNPNFTSFGEINKDIISGFKENFKNYKQIFERDKAIEIGFSKLSANDTLVILGKGVETLNKINGVNVPHNDLECVENCIKKFYNFVKKENVKN